MRVSQPSGERGEGGGVGWPPVCLVFPDAVGIPRWFSLRGYRTNHTRLSTPPPTVVAASSSAEGKVVLVSLSLSRTHAQQHTSAVNHGSHARTIHTPRSLMGTT